VVQALGAVHTYAARCCLQQQLRYAVLCARNSNFAYFDGGVYTSQAQRSNAQRMCERHESLLSLIVCQHGVSITCSSSRVLHYSLLQHLFLFMSSTCYILVRRTAFSAGPDLRGANWAVAQGPPQLRGFHKKTVKNYYLRKHKNTFTKYKSKYRST